MDHSDMPYQTQDIEEELGDSSEQFINEQTEEEIITSEIAKFKQTLEEDCQAAQDLPKLVPNLSELWVEGVIAAWQKCKLL